MTFKNGKERQKTKREDDNASKKSNEEHAKAIANMKPDEQLRYEIEKL